MSNKTNDKNADNRVIMDQNKTAPSNSLEDQEREQPISLAEARKTDEDKPVDLSVKETEEVEDTGEKRHGVAPTSGNIVTDEKNAYKENVTGLKVNGDTNDHEKSVEDQEKIEKQLSKGNIVARVIISTGDYLKVKFFRDNKPFTVYKGKQGRVSEAKEWLNKALKRDEDNTK